jgi:hypothetical protein
MCARVSSGSLFSVRLNWIAKRNEMKREKKTGRVTLSVEVTVLVCSRRKGNDKVRKRCGLREVIHLVIASGYNNSKVRSRSHARRAILLSVGLSVCCVVRKEIPNLRNEVSEIMPTGTNLDR